MRRGGLLLLVAATAIHAACGSNDGNGGGGTSTPSAGASGGGSGGAGAAGGAGGEGGTGAGGQGGTGPGGGAGGQGGTGTGGQGGTGAGGGAGGQGGTGGQGGAGSASGGGGSGGSDRMYGYCLPGCREPADCCQPGDANCPSIHYTCDLARGVCGPAQCTTSSDCTARGLPESSQCVQVEGINQCVLPCTPATENTDCPGDSKCIGVDDTMAHYCKVVECVDDADCSGFGSHCIDSSCRCTGAEGECSPGDVCAK